MNTFAIALVIITTIASLGVAVVSWQAMSGMSDELYDLAGFDASQFEDRSN